MDYEADLHEEKLGFLVRVRRVPGGLVFGKWENHEIEDEYWRIKKDQVQYEFIPDAKGILEEILPVSFKVRLFKCLLDAAVSEQIARRVAMKAATENADEIIKAITQEYNRARQAKITKELAEIIGGAAALE
jgi:ATP synthase F1 gamma subunit